MIERGPDSPSHDERVNDAIVEYLRAIQRGAKLDDEEWLRRHPDLGGPLASFLADRDAVLPVAAPLRAAGPPSPVPAEAPTMAPGESPAAPLGTVRYFGDYELLEEIARGGMGVVYKARQISLNRLGRPEDDPGRPARLGRRRRALPAPRPRRPPSSTTPTSCRSTRSASTRASTTSA